MSVRLRLLGPPGILHEDEARPGLPLGKPLALLVYLVDHGPATRDHLAEVLWPSSPRSKGRASVRQALWLIRQRLGEGVFTSEEPVALCANFITTDVAELLEHLKLKPQATSLTAKLAAPLEGLTVADAPPWRNWAEDFRSRTSHRIGSHLLALAATAEVDGNPQEAERFLRLASDMEPYRGETRLKLIEHLLGRGDIDQAEDAVADARRLDDPDLSQALSTLDQRIREIRQNRFTHSDTSFKTDCVGRSREISQLMSLYREAEKGRGRVALITGSAGIGKTRLAVEFASMVSAEGASVVHVKAHDAERILKFNVLAELARALLSLPGAAGITAASDEVLRTFLPSLHRPGRGVSEPGPSRGAPTLSAAYTGPGSQPIGGPSGPVHHVALADAFLDLIDAVSSEHPLVIVLDDLHWCDDGSRAVVTRTARAMSSTHGCWVMTSRRNPDPSLARVLHAIESLDAVRSLDLVPLTSDDIEELLGLRITFDRPDHLQSVAHELQRVSGGNPLFIVEILRQLQGEGILATAEAGEWTLRVPPGGLSLDLPIDLRATLLSRLRNLDEGCIEVAHKLARRGIPTYPDDLGGPEVWPSVQTLLEAGLVAPSEPAGHIDFVHDEVRSAVRGLTRPRPRVWYTVGTVAAVLVLAAAAWASANEAEAHAGEQSPFGGGTVVLVHGGERLAYRFRGEPPIAVKVPAPGNQIPLWAKPFRRADGGLLWFASSTEVGRAPDLVRYEADGSARVLVARPGDENPQSLSPDGATLLYTSEDPDRPGYETDLWQIKVDGENPRRVLPANQLLNATWSPSGDFIAVRKIGTPDTVEIRTPDFDLLYEHLIDRVEAYIWCGPNELLLVSEPVLSQPKLLLLAPQGELRVLPIPMTRLGRQVACSPDGSQILVETVIEGSPQILRFDRATEEVSSTDIPGGQAFFWLPDTLPVIPTTVRLSKDTIRLLWGGTQDLTLEATLSDGSPATLGGGDHEGSSVRWRSTKEDVAFVSQAGTLYANGIGEATIIAGVPGSARDSAHVVVTGAERSAALLLDSMTTPWEPRWIGLGQPQPTLERDGGRTVLHLRGDGSVSDGIISRESFRSPTGFTLEWEMKLPLSRTDRQSIGVCLARVDPPTAGDVRNWSLWAPHSQSCFDYPKGYLARFRPDVGSLSTLYSPHLFSTAPSLPSDEWVHAALQIRPDGTPAIFLNRRLVIEGDARLTGINEPGWRILMTGHSVETRLLVRNVVLWPSARYR